MSIGSIQLRQEEDRNGENFVEKQVVDFLNKKGIDIHETDILACHTLERRHENGTQKVIVRFANRKSKVKAMMNARKLKGTNVYINEHLTKKNAELAKTARDLRTAGKINSTWTRDCKIFVKDNDGKVSLVKDNSDFDQF